MKKLLAIAFLILGSQFLISCRLDRYTLKEPLDGQCIEVKSGDRISVVLDENATTGYLWSAYCDDDEISFARETEEPDRNAPICGASHKVRIIIRVHRGFSGPAHVKLVYHRPWQGGETAREIDLSLYRKPEDNAPWK